MNTSVEVIGTQQIFVTETAINTVELTAPAQPAVVEVATAGPQGPQGAAGPAGANTLSALSDVDTTAKVASSVLYYNASSGKWLGNDINTITSITDGGSW